MKVTKSFELIICSAALMFYSMALGAMAERELTGAVFWLLVYALTAAIGKFIPDQFEHESLPWRLAFWSLYAIAMFVASVVCHFIADAAGIRFIDPAFRWASHIGLTVGALAGITGLASGLKSLIFGPDTSVQTG